MKYLKLFERYSMPDSVITLSDEIIQFCSQKFNTWWFRKSLSNYSEIFSLPIKTKSSDFPVKKVNLKLQIVLSNRYETLNRIGFSHHFKSKDTKLRPKLYKDGSFVPGIEIKIYVPRNKSSYSEEEFINVLEDIVYHELFHSYQSYKLFSKGIEEAGSGVLTNSIYHLVSNLGNFEYFHRFVNTSYICSNRQEIGAHIAQIWAKEGDYWIEDLKELATISSEEVLKNIREEVESDDEMEVVKFFNSLIEEDNSGDIPFFSDFESLIFYLHNLIKKNYRYISKKIGKIKYSKSLNESTQSNEPSNLEIRKNLFKEMAVPVILPVAHWKIVELLLRKLEGQNKFSMQKLGSTKYVLTWEEDFLGKNISYELTAYKHKLHGIGETIRIKLIAKIGSETLLGSDMLAELESLENIDLFIRYVHFFIEYPKSEIQSDFLVDLEDELDVNLEDMGSTIIDALPNGYHSFALNFGVVSDSFFEKLKVELTNLDSKLKSIGLKLVLYTTEGNTYRNVEDAFKYMKRAEQIRWQKYLQIYITK